ncbi:hypothetical protein ATM97_30475 [Nocardia sp. MH4]|uniref:hypothetical protein n=1 Tax=Nocardia TaxID=1817 RepID=UPI001C4FD736|nr:MULTISPECIES: hypothetical protein [Nocardia]MBW0275733.1 hypothetical protein [Nocardia sp. MH4]
MSARTTRLVAGAVAAAAISFAAPLGTAQAASPVADSGSSSIGCTSDTSPCALRPLFDLITALSTGSAQA